MLPSCVKKAGVISWTRYSYNASCTASHCDLIGFDFCGLLRTISIKKKTENAAGNRHENSSNPYFKAINIREGAMNFSYNTVFQPLLADTLITNVIVEEPYIRNVRQLQNVCRFFEMLVKYCPQLRDITLVTKRTLHDSTPESMLSANAAPDMRDLLHDLTSSLRDAHDIKLIISYSDTVHDREIRFSNGLIVRIGRGLDYFHPIATSLAIGKYDLDLRPCKETTINIYYQQDKRLKMPSPAASLSEESALSTNQQSHDRGFDGDVDNDVGTEDAASINEQAIDIETDDYDGPLKFGTIERRSDGRVRRLITVPNRVIGFLIGPGGATVQEIRSVSRANIRIPQAPLRNSVDMDSFTTVTVSGRPDDVQLACDMLQIRSSELVSEVVQVPSKLVGYLIGAGGTGVNEIRKNSGASISINMNSAETNNNGMDSDGKEIEQMITVQGRVDEVQLAVELIKTRLAGLVTQELTALQHAIAVHVFGGPEGERLQATRHASGATIQRSHGYVASAVEGSAGCATKRRRLMGVLTITGKPDEVKLAADIMNKQLLEGQASDAMQTEHDAVADTNVDNSDAETLDNDADDNKIETPGKAANNAPPAAHLHGTHIDGEIKSHAAQTSLTLDEDSVAYILGYDGNGLNKITTATGAVVQISRPNTAAGHSTTEQTPDGRAKGQQTITIFGQSNEQVEMARDMIQRRVSGVEKRVVRIGKRFAGSIIGLYGARIREITQISGANVIVLRSDESARTKAVTIVGQVDEIDKAVDLLREQILHEKQHALAALRRRVNASAN